MVALNQPPVDYQKMYEAALAATLNSMSVTELVTHGVIPRNAPVDYPLPPSGLTPFLHFSNLGMINANLSDILKIEAALSVCPHIMQRKIIRFVMELTGGSVNPDVIMLMWKVVKDTEAALEDEEPKPTEEKSDDLPG